MAPESGYFSLWLPYPLPVPSEGDHSFFLEKLEVMIKEEEKFVTTIAAPEKYKTIILIALALYIKSNARGH